MADSLDTGMYFLARESRFESEKPYSMRYPPTSALPQSNIVHDRREVSLRSLRKCSHRLKFGDCGFGIMNLKSKMSYNDFQCSEKINSIYLKEISEGLKNTLSASHVFILDHVVRRRHQSFPISTGKDYTYNQPTSMVHIDFTHIEAKRMLRLLYGPTAAASIMSSRWQIVNAWRPLRGPLNDWPLGLCDASSVDFDSDTMPIDIVYRDWVTENMQVHYNGDQRWYYLPDQMPSEVLIFKSAESDATHFEGTPHAGFYNPHVGLQDLPRESIDCRAFVFFAPLHPFPPEIGNPFQMQVEEGRESIQLGEQVTTNKFL